LVDAVGALGFTPRLQTFSDGIENEMETGEPVELEKEENEFPLLEISYIRLERELSSRTV
jgi:hypothetical protein